ncbi:conjugal transfer protein TraF [Desulfobulbus sp.]|uniref:conjugal transfer protein TraF n=1 Tax=Desulfobulbus sp. TaxID=895 RepID=UPI0027B8B91D|nr:conjugal transfer protein TraF [Desulfobulbus sp.]
MFTRSAIRPYRFGSLGLCLTLLATPVWCGTSAPSATASFYQESKHGWFWYEDPAPAVEEEREMPVTESKASPLSREVSLAQYSTETLWNMHPDDFQQLLNGLQKKAVQYPTEQNILEYLSIQDIARRKALAYANATQYVTRKRSDLFNISQVYPTSSPGAVARVQMQQEEIAGTIREARADHALLFFVAAGCGFCEKQAQILAYFVDKYGWQVKPVDMERQPNLALRFNITTMPTLLLIRQDREASMPIATGVATLPEIERNLYQAIRSMRGDTSMESFTTYEFQKGSSLDPTSILKIQTPWQSNGPINQSSMRPSP